MCKDCNLTVCSSRCPDYVPQKSFHYCVFCGESIVEGEEYIENFNGECRHHDCYYGIEELLQWAGCEIKILEEEF